MEEFVNLHNRTVSRSEVERVVSLAKEQNNTEVIYRLSRILNAYPTEQRFVINIKDYPTPPTALAGAHHTGDYHEALDENGRLRKGYKFVKGKIIPPQPSHLSDDELTFLAAAGIDYFEQAPDDETQGLGKPIPAADIYKMITDKIIKMLKSTKASDYKKTWEDDAFFIPINFDSKKPYRGVNRMLLQERIGLTEAFANPYFLTFKQIKKHKGTLKKGAKGYEVVYYSIRYVVPADKNIGRKAYSSTNAHKVIDFLDKHKLPENIVTRIPMIRYYNVYNGEDITGIDFKLPEVKIGRAIPETASENEAAHLIVENYPNPPAIKHGGNEAYYKLSEDLVRMPKIEQFDSVNDYYRTLFHELTHSTRHESRLNREKISFRFGDSGYAKEELVAEFGAVFLSAWAGIMWYNNKNHAAYLKGWNSAIKEAENDNKFLMKAASLAQAATDYILNLNAAGQPAFLSKYEKNNKKAEKTKPEAQKATEKADNADKKYKFIAFYNSYGRINGIYSYQNLTINEFYLKNTFDDGIKVYAPLRSLEKIEEAKRIIEEQYIEGKDFICLKFESKKREEYYSLLIHSNEKPKKKDEKPSAKITIALKFSDVEANRQMIEGYRNSSTGKINLLKTDMIGTQFHLSMFEKYMAIDDIAALYGKGRKEEAQKDYAFVRERIERAFNHHLRAAKKYNTIEQCTERFIELLPNLLAKGGQWLEAKANSKNSATAKGQFTKVIKQAFDEIGNVAVGEKPNKAKKTKPEAPEKAITTNDSNNFLYFNIDRSNPQPQPISRVKAKYKNIDFEQEYNRISDKNGYFKPNFNNKRDLQILHALCSDFIGTINTEDYFERAPKSKTTGIMSLKKIVSKDKLRPVLTGVYIDKDYYIATDAFKLIWLPRPKNDEYKTGWIFDLNFKCQKFGGCKPEDALIEGRFPIDSTVNMKNAPIAYTSQQLDITILIDHLYRGEKAIKSLAPYQNPMVIALHINKENIYIDIKNLLDALDVLRANGAKSLTMNFENLSGKSPIHIQTDNKLQALIMARYFATEKDIPTVDTCLMIAPLPLTLTEISKPTKGLSAPADGTLFGSLPIFKTLKEAKKYFKAWAYKHLRGKKVFHKELDKYVVFSSKGIDHVLSSKISLKKMYLIQQAEEMLKNSHLIAFVEDYKKRDNIKGAYRMRTTATFEGEEVKVILTLREGENGVIYYDHKIEEIEESTTPPRKSRANPFCGDSAPTNFPAKTVPNSLNAPQHAGILKEALTEKGKLKKGWYFQDYGIIDPKGKYHPLERDYSLEYNLIEKELRSRAFLQDEKRKIKGFEENKKLEEAIKVFLKELSKENRKHFKNSKAMEVFYWAFPFTLESNSTFYTFEESNPYINKRLQELDQYFTDNNELFERLENYKTLRRYNLKSLGLHISAKISSFIDKQGKVIRGDSNKLNQKYGLSTPITTPTVYVEHLPEETNQQISTSANTLDAKMAALQTRNWETFVIANPQLQRFLGDVERKSAESTVITIAGGAGSGKTRFAFQFINALAQNYKVGHASLEEHPDSKLYYDKVQQYIDETALPNIEAPEIKNLDQLEALIQRNEVIVIDSFAKLQELNPRFLLDRDLRKKYDGKLFLLIYQLTGEGKMRGGSKSEFDGDIILLTHVAPDYRENYIYPSKNRYNALPATQLRYSTYFQQMLDIPQELGTGSQPQEAISLPPAPQTNVYEVIY